jgi:hypothetical protein
MAVMVFLPNSRKRLDMRLARTQTVFYTKTASRSVHGTACQSLPAQPMDLHGAALSGCKVQGYIGAAPLGLPLATAGSLSSLGPSLVLVLLGDRRNVILALGHWAFCVCFFSRLLLIP